MPLGHPWDKTILDDASACVYEAPGVEVALFALVFLRSWCDFLPRFDGLSFLAMWKALVVGRESSPEPLLRRKDWLLIIDGDEVV